MPHDPSPRTLQALVGAQSYPHEPSPDDLVRQVLGAPGRRRFTVALSRQAGAQGAAVARAVGARLGWPVFDRELLERVAEETGLRVQLLEGMDEKGGTFLQECFDAFLSAPVTENVYLRHLVQTVAALAARGECVIVGRGVPVLLPAETTLRVRVVADRADCVANVQRSQG